MSRVKFSDVLAEVDSRMRRHSSLPARLVRRPEAGAYLGCPQLFAHMEAAGWIEPVVSRHGMVLFDLDDMDVCITRLRGGEYPEPPAKPLPQLPPQP